MNTKMEINGLTCTFNLPKALEEREFAQGLPPYAPTPAYKVDEYKSPDAWMSGSGKASSYFVPVSAGKGMWLDFTGNQQHTHHVAVLVSIQGINPITGQKQVGTELRQHKDNCPVHNVAFGQDRFCPVCKYKWPPQNYIATTGGGALWIDGFRNAQGEVRQYVFTEETAKGVAAQLIGGERVYAISMAFYLSKQPKPQPKYSPYRDGGLESLGGYESVGSSYNMKSLGAEPMLRSASRGGSSVKRLEVAAGAKINQEIGFDPQDIDTFWEKEPAGLLYVNYCDVETCNSILAEGKRDLTAGGEGFLAGVTKYNQ